MLFWATNYCGVEVAVCCDLLGIFTCVLYHLGLVDSGGKKIMRKKIVFILLLLNLVIPNFEMFPHLEFLTATLTKKRGTLTGSQMSIRLFMTKR